jgi:hypothetical protein
MGRSRISMRYAAARISTSGWNASASRRRRIAVAMGASARASSAPRPATAARASAAGPSSAAAARWWMARSLSSRSASGGGSAGTRRRGVPRGTRTRSDTDVAGTSQPLLHGANATSAALPSQSRGCRANVPRSSTSPVSSYSRSPSRSVVPVRATRSRAPVRRFRRPSCAASMSSSRMPRSRKNQRGMRTRSASSCSSTWLLR